MISFNEAWEKFKAAKTATSAATATSEPIVIETPKRVTKISDICNALSDTASVKMFMEGINQNGLTQKQYYARLHALKEAGLVRKCHGHYEMTSTGLVVKRALLLVERALSYKMNISLRFYDVLRSDNKQIPPEEYIDKLFFNDTEIRDIILNEQRVKCCVGANIEMAMYESE